MLNWSTQLKTLAGIKSIAELQTNIFRTNGPLWSGLSPGTKLRVFKTLPHAMTIEHCIEICLLHQTSELIFSLKRAKIPILRMLIDNEKYFILSMVLERNINKHVQLLHILYRFPIDHVYRCLRAIFVNSACMVIDLLFHDRVCDFVSLCYLNIICESPELSKMCLVNYIQLVPDFMTRKMYSKYVYYGKRMLNHPIVMSEFHKILHTRMYADDIITSAFNRNLLKWMMRKLSWYTGLLIYSINMKYEEIDYGSIENVYIQYFATLIDESAGNLSLMNELRRIVSLTPHIMYMLLDALCQVDFHIDDDGYVGKLKKLICKI